MEIDYLDEFLELQDKDTFRGQQWLGERKRLVKEYSWAIPNHEVIEYISSFDSIIEVGAGGGYWADLVSCTGSDITAYDIDPPEDTYYPVHQMAVSDLQLNSENVLMVWPPYDDQMSAEVVSQHPENIFYVGELKRGCTGCSEFFDILDREYETVSSITIPSYDGIHDNFYHCKRGKI